MWLCLFLSIALCLSVNGLLYPRETETRQLLSLDGLWSFRLDEQGVGESERWFTLPHLPPPTILMPVPSSFNDVTQNVTIHQHIGWIWYARDFFVHHLASRWVLRIQSTNYEARVWINGQPAVNHSGGHLPFEVDIYPFLSNNSTASKVRLVVAINNTLSTTTLPPAELHIVNPTYRYLDAAFDSYNYAGIDRSVLLYSTSNIFVEDIDITTESIAFDSDYNARSAVLNYSVTIGGIGQNESVFILVEFIDEDGIVIQNSTQIQSQLIINKPHLWQPCGMNYTHPCDQRSYLYTFKVTIFTDQSQKTILDVYHLDSIGIRTVRLNGSKFLINERPFYFHGANTNEDSDIRGRGYDPISIVKHFNQHSWFHGNSYRTAPYPIADEFYLIADRYGIVVIDSVPATGMRNTEYFSNTTLEHHKQVIVELLKRDRNHPSVVAWSLANEPASSLPVAKDYFQTLISFTKQLDRQRPVTVVINDPVENDNVAQFCDMICINRYYGWYTENGRLDQVEDSIYNELIKWNDKHPNKPIMFTEFGAEAVVGLHNDPSVMFTEEYQVEFLTSYHRTFDKVSTLKNPSNGFFVGELIFTMYDFGTEQNIKRIAGSNMKGLFTRQRQPKASAFIVKKRYEQLEQNK